MTGEEGCSEGFTGALCSVCEDGYFFDSQSASCIECNDSGVTVVAAIVMLMTLMCVVYLFVISCGKRIMQSVGKQTGLAFVAKYSRSKSMNFRLRKENFLKSEDTSRKYQNKLKQLITLFQILSSLPSTLAISFPSVFYQFTFIFNLINLGSLFNDLGLSCSVDGLDYVSALIAITLLPIAATLALYLIQLMHVHFILTQYSEPFREIANTYQRIEVLKSTYLYIFLFGTYLILPGVSTILFGMLRPCVDLDPEGTNDHGSHFHMEADYSIECSSERYDLGVIWAAVFVMVYPVGIPCMYFYLLYQARGLIEGRARSDVNALDEQGLEDMEKAALKLSSLRFLYQEYLPEVRKQKQNSTHYASIYM